MLTQTVCSAVAGYAAVMSRMSTRKISETLLDFGLPVLGELDGDESRAVWEAAVEFVIGVWDAHVFATAAWGRPDFLERLRQTMREPGTPPEMVSAFKVLSHRWADKFVGETRAVGEWKLRGAPRQWSLWCDARGPGAGPARMVE